MLHLNGVKAAQAIRADLPNKTTPLLTMTANAFDEDRDACLASGMHDHTGKSVNPQCLCEILSGCLDTSASLRREKQP